MIYLILAEYLQSQNSKYIVGKTVFINQAPANEKFLALIRDNPGGIKIDGEITTERRGSFQLIVRSPNPEVAYTAIKEIVDVITLSGVQLGDYLIKSTRPTQEPIGYQISAASLFEYSVNFSLLYGIV
jgi:hypothetical protein